MVPEAICNIAKFKSAWLLALYYSPIVYANSTSGSGCLHKDFEQSGWHPYRVARIWVALLHMIGQYPYLWALKVSIRFRRSCKRYKSLEDAGRSTPNLSGAPKCLLNVKYGYRPYLCGVYLPADYSKEQKVDFVVINFYGIAWRNWPNGRKHTAGIAKWALDSSRCAVVIPEYGGQEPVERMRQDFYAILLYAANIASTCCTTPTIRVMCHSAGAQIFSTILIRHLTGESFCYPMELVDHVIFMAGVYNAPAHYLFEAKRGVEGVSMLYRSLGGLEGMKKESTVLELRNERNLRSSAKIPKILVAHGDIDRIVPVSQSWELFCEMQKLSWPVQFYMARSADHLLPFHLFTISDRWRCDPQLKRVMSEFLLCPVEPLSRL